MLIVACATPNDGGKNTNKGFGKAMLGIAQLVLSPLQIAAGLLEGIASIPYYLAINVQDINNGMIAAYGKRINAVPESGDTGEIFNP